MDSSGGWDVCVVEFAAGIWVTGTGADLNPQPNSLRLGFASLDEKRITRGIEILGEVVKTEFRKRQRGARSELHSRVALV